MENPSKSPLKCTYKIRNWKEYDKSLKKRGEFDAWLTPRLLRIWSDIDVSSRQIGEKIYPDIIIEFCLPVKSGISTRLQ